MKREGEKTEYERRKDKIRDEGKERRERELPRKERETEDAGRREVAVKNETEPRWARERRRSDDRRDTG